MSNHHDALHEFGSRLLKTKNALNSRSENVKGLKTEEGKLRKVPRSPPPRSSGRCLLTLVFPLWLALAEQDLTTKKDEIDQLERDEEALKHKFMEAKTRFEQGEPRLRLPPPLALAAVGLTRTSYCASPTRPPACGRPHTRPPTRSPPAPPSHHFP